jgi:O-antigen ligase
MADLHYPGVMMVAVILGTLVRQPQMQKRMGAALKCLAPFLVLLVLMWVAGMANGYTDESSYQIGQFVSNLIFCAALVIWVDSEKRFILTALALLFSGAYYVRTVITDPRMVREEIAGQHFDRVFLRSFESFGNPNYMALLMVLMIFLALSLFAVKLKGWQRIMVIGVLMGYLYVFLKCQSRGATIAFVVAFPVFWLMQKRKALLGGISALAIVVGLVFFAPSDYFQRMGTVVTYEEDASAMGRLALWNISIDLIKSHPVIGIGPSNFMKYAPNSQHESYLEIASETGLLGLLMYVVCLIRGLVMALSARSLASERQKNLPVLHSFAGGTAACVVAIMVQGFFTGFSYREFVYTVLTLAFLVKNLAVLAEVQAPVAVPYVQTFPRSIRPAYETPHRA